MNHKWKPAPTKAEPKRMQCEREDCRLFRYQYWGRRRWVYHYKRGRKVAMYGVMGDKTPPCGPPTKEELEWLAYG